MLSAGFAAYMFRAYFQRRSGPHLLWWAWGGVWYGLGTALESSITLAGNEVWLTKAWYIAGALLGGFPLAQGAAFLHTSRERATRLGWIMSAFIFVVAVLVVLSPVNAAALEPTRPSGAILEWRFVRFFTPIINLYAFAWLVGGAIRSALVGRRLGFAASFISGNWIIALGGLLPGIGGSMAKAGKVEALYVLELLGLILLWIGAEIVRRARPASDQAVELRTQASTTL